MRVPTGSIRTLLFFFALAALGLAGCESRPPAREPDPDSPAIQLRRITASDAQDEDQLGWSVDLDGDDLIAGTNIISSHDYRSGKAFLHARNAGGTDAWGEVEKLEAVNGEYFDMYGYSVAVDGDIAVVGAPWEDQAEEDAGSAYVYARNQGGAGSWGLLKKLTASDSRLGDGFGYAVAIDGDVIIVGAAHSSSVTWAGGVAYVYVRDRGGADNWGEAARIVPGDLPEAAYFGFSVSLHGDLAVIGSLYDIGPGNRCGAAYVFARDLGGPEAWGEVKKLTAFDAEDQDQFGCSVCVSGDLIIVGADWKHESGVERGAAYIFGRDQGGPDNWGLIKKLSAGDAAYGDAFGISVSISGTHALVGAPGADGSVTDLGAVYVFSRDLGGANAWGEAGKVMPYDANESSGFGNSTALDGDLFAAGAPLKRGGGNHRGAVYIYRLRS